MNVLRHTPQGLNSTDVQIWDNAAFDNGESEDSSAIMKSSWSPVKPALLFSSSESLDSFSSKENQNPLFENKNDCLSVRSPALPLKSIHQNRVVENSRMKSIKASSKLGLGEKSVLISGSEEEVHDEKKIDQEIEEIEKEINRLSSRLEALRIEKAEKIVKTVERKGRVIPAKFMEQKQNVKNAEEKKKADEGMPMSAKSKVQRRGLSMGPSEIVAGARRRGLSLGPAEIFAGVKPRQIGKQEPAITPIQPIQNRRKSCFWKLQDIEEEKVTKERRKSLSVSPKSRKLNAKIQASRLAATTVASRKTVKKEDSIVNSIQPKKLFKDGEKSAATNKKPLRPGRVVASRYNQSTNQASAMRKRSLPENDRDESKRCDKKRSLSVGKSRTTQPEIKNSATEGRVKKRWEIPSEIVVHRSSESDSPPPAISKVPDILPRIRTARCFIETPRDSGPAKRVADLVGKKSYFSIDEEVEEPSVCQTLSFAEDEDEAK